MNDIFEHTFAKAPAELLRQRETLRTSSIGQSPEGIDAPVHS